METDSFRKRILTAPPVENPEETTRHSFAGMQITTTSQSGAGSPYGAQTFDQPMGHQAHDDPSNPVLGQNVRVIVHPRVPGEIIQLWKTSKI